jgi:hypothetical protein
LRLLIGTAPPAANAKTSNTATAEVRQMPQGPIVEKMKIAQETPLQLDFVETPLENIMAILCSSTGITFSMQPPALEEAGIRSDEPISLNTSEVPLRAAL